MSLVGKNKALFSYNNKNKSGSEFMYKDFEKTKSFHSYFANASFVGTSFRGASLKYCNFSGCMFESDDFIGTNCKGSKFDWAKFNDCIFVSCNMDKAKFKNAVFKNCYMIGTPLKKTNGEVDTREGLIVLKSYPPEADFSEQLIREVERLRDNENIRRSGTVVIKRGKINTLTLMILKKEYTEDELIALLPLLPTVINKPFYTVSYLKAMLKKLKIGSTI